MSQHEATIGTKRVQSNGEGAFKNAEAVEGVKEPQDPSEALSQISAPSALKSRRRFTSAVIHWTHPARLRIVEAA